MVKRSGASFSIKLPEIIGRLVDFNGNLRNNSHAAGRRDVCFKTCLDVAIAEEAINESPVSIHSIQRFACWRKIGEPPKILASPCFPFQNPQDGYSKNTPHWALSSFRARGSTLTSRIGISLLRRTPTRTKRAQWYWQKTPPPIPIQLAAAQAENEETTPKHHLEGDPLGSIPTRHSLLRTSKKTSSIWLRLLGKKQIKLIPVVIDSFKTNRGE